MTPGYTMMAAGMLAVSALLAWRLRPGLLKSKAFGAALAGAATAQLVFDNLAVWKGFWMFGESATVGVSIPFMPVENLLFGIGLFVFTVVSWEWNAHQRVSD